MPPRPHRSVPQGRIGVRSSNCRMFWFESHHCSMSLPPAPVPDDFQALLDRVGAPGSSGPVRTRLAANGRHPGLPLPHPDHRPRPKLVCPRHESSARGPRISGPRISMSLPRQPHCPVRITSDSNIDPLSTGVSREHPYCGQSRSSCSRLISPRTASYLLSSNTCDCIRRIGRNTVESNTTSNPGLMPDMREPQR